MKFKLCIEASYKDSSTSKMQSNLRVLSALSFFHRGDILMIVFVKIKFSKNAESEEGWRLLYELSERKPG